MNDNLIDRLEATQTSAVHYRQKESLDQRTVNIVLFNLITMLTSLVIELASEK